MNDKDLQSDLRIEDAHQSLFGSTRRLRAEGEEVALKLDVPEATKAPGEILLAPNRIGWAPQAAARPQLLAIVAALLLAGCADRAKPAYGVCQKLQLVDNIEGAWKACMEAVGIDPTSTSGQSASKTLAEMKSTYEKRKAEREAQEAREAEERRKADAAAVVESKPTLTGRRYSQIDDICSADGLGRQGFSFSGGTVGDVEATYGCAHITENFFCCYPSRMR